MSYMTSSRILMSEVPDFLSGSLEKRFVTSLKVFRSKVHASPSVPCFCIIPGNKVYDFLGPLVGP